MRTESRGKVIATCADCGELLKIHAKGACKPCYERRAERKAYMRAYHRRPEVKARRAEYVAKNRDRFLAYYRRRNEKRYPTAGALDELVRVPVKGWGCRA
jgi:hypothetical protein